MIKMYQQEYKKKLEDKKCNWCNERPIYNYKRQLCRRCYNYYYINKRREESGITKCSCGCNETIPALTTTMTIAQFKHGHSLRYTEENAKRIRENGNGWIYVKNNEIV